jgi:hypothetical protein
MKAQALKLKNVHFGDEWNKNVKGRWDYEDFKKNEKWRKGWISFDCALFNPDDDRIYCGITSFDGDIFRAYDRRSRQFVDLGVHRIVDEYDAKFHRALIKGRDGCLYAAIALLHCIDRYNDAPGGAIVRYDPETGALTKVGIPVPHVYIQSLVLDESRHVAYGLGFHPQCLLQFDMKKRKGKTIGLITSGYGGGVMSENIVLDDKGCVWSNWGMTRAWDYSPGPDAVRLCKYDPVEDRIIFYQKGLPLPDGHRGYAPVESFHNFGDGFLYAGAHNGSLYRLDPETVEARHLCTPIADRRSRLASLVKAEDGVAYGVVGRDGQCELTRFFYKTGKFEMLGLVRDSHQAMWQCHDIVMTNDGVLYACENDNTQRSSYLWEIRL